MKKYILSHLVSFVMILFSSSMALANFIITPVKLEIEKNKKITSFTIQNNNSDARSFQISVYKVEIDEKGEKSFSTTDDIEATPTMIKIKPGATQTIRASISRDDFSKEQDAYSVGVEELNPENRKANAVSLVQKFYLPVTIKE